MKTYKQPALFLVPKRICLFLLFGIFLANVASAQFKSADELIKAHMQAMGGYEAYKAIHTLTSIGTYEEPRFKEVHRFDQRRPNMVRVTTSYNEETGSFGYCEGFDGAAWEYSARVPVRVSGEPARALRNAAQFEPSYIDYQLKGYSARYNGLVKLKGYDLHHLQIHRSGNRIDNYFFDQGTLMNNINIGNAPFHGEGKSIEILSVSSDYRPVNGVMIPHRIEQKSGDKVLSKLVWDKIEANGAVADEWFSPPLSREQEAFKTFREQMLAGKLDDLEKQYKAYFDIARTQFDKKHENALNTFGYELMSYERYDDAIEVFIMAFSRHPESSNIPDSLGEAYLAKGDSINAFKYYQIALHMNPGNKYAAEVLQKLSKRLP